jgi:hypothetical protein
MVFVDQTTRSPASSPNKPLGYCISEFIMLQVLTALDFKMSLPIFKQEPSKAAILERGTAHFRAFDCNRQVRLSDIDCAVHNA